MPDSPHPTMTRRAWRAMSALGCVLGAIAIFFAAVGSRQRDDQALRTEQAVCATIRYAENASARTKQDGNTDASLSLSTLARSMRETGVNCPPTR